MSIFKPSRELSFSEIFEYAWKIFSEHATNIVLPYLILGIIGVILDNIPIPRIIIIRFSIFSSIVQMFLSMIVAGIVIKYVADVIEGLKPTLRLSLDYVVIKLADIIVTSIILAIILSIGFMLLIIPGIIFGIMFSLTMQVVVLEGKSPIKALGRSRMLVRGRWTLTFIIIVLLIILLFLANVIPIIGWILAMIIESYRIVVLTTFYYSLRAREKQLSPQVV